MKKGRFGFHLECCYLSRK